jgi:hypothetical protein
MEMAGAAHSYAVLRLTSRVCWQEKKGGDAKVQVGPGLSQVWAAWGPGLGRVEIECTWRQWPGELHQW